MKESIATNEHIKAFFRWFTLEDGGLVVLDIVHACDHARQCVNDLKRSRVKCPLFSVKKEPSDDKEVRFCCSSSHTLKPMFSIHTLVLRLLSLVSLGTLHLIPSALSLESHRRTVCEHLEAD